MQGARRTREIGTAELSLRESEARYRSLVENSTDWIWELQLDGRHSYSNNRIEAILGYAPEEFNLLTREERMHPEDVEQFEAHLPGLIAQKQGWCGWVLRFRHRDGSYRYLESNAHPVLDADGNVCGYRGVDRDITERRAMELSLRESNERFALAVRGTNDGLWDWNIETSEDYFSGRWKAILGYKDDELYPNVTTFLNLVHPADRERVRRAVDAHLDERQPYELELRMNHKEGHYIWVLASGQAVWNEAGKPVRMAGSITDITVRKVAEEKSRQNTYRFKKAERLAKIGSWDLDLVTNRLTWSDEIFRIFGIDPKQFGACYEAFLDRVHPEDRGTVDAAYRSSVENREAYLIEHRLKLADGSIKYVAEHCETYYDTRGNPVRSIGTVQDITERVKAQHDIGDLVTRLEAVTDVAFDAIIIMRDGLVSEARGRLVDQMGYAPNEVEGELFESLIAPAFRSQIGQALRADPIEPQEVVAIRRNGSMFPVEIYGRTISSRGEGYQVCALRDIAVRRRLEREVAAAADSERARIGRELHDGVGALMFGASLSLERAHKQLGTESSPVIKTLISVRDLLRSGFEEIRRISHLLTPPMHDSLDLCDCLRKLATQLTQDLDVVCTVRCAPPIEIRDCGVKLHLCRIVQESITNALRHSQARNLSLNAYQAEGLVHLEVVDDGIGISAQSLQDLDSLGLRSMYHRAKMIDGSFEIVARETGGTRVYCCCPI